VGAEARDLGLNFLSNVLPLSKSGMTVVKIYLPNVESAKHFGLIARYN
jgi:hypothetical protein